VHHRDLLAAVQEGTFKGILGNSLRFLFRDDFEALEDTGVDLVLDAAVLAFEVLSDDDDIDVAGVFRLDVRQLEDMDDCFDWSIPLT
jgi:hypothetical protein